MEGKEEKSARKLKGKMTLEEIMEEPQCLVEGNKDIEDMVLNYTMECGLNAEKIEELSKTGITFRAWYKTGDGMDAPYDGSKEGYKNIVENLVKNPQMVESEGHMQWNGLFICHECDELFDTEVKDFPEITEGKIRECPNCGSSNDISLATAPKWLYFEETVEFDDSVETVKDLEKELSKIFKKEVNL